MILQTDVVWPSSLPLPSLDYSGVSNNATISTETGLGAIARRSRRNRNYTIADVKWTFTSAQFEAFESFFLNDLGNGTAQFKMELRFPRNSVLREWSVRIGDYQATRDDGYWIVSTSLQIINVVDFAGEDSSGY